MAAFLDNCKFTPTAGGTADWIYSAAVTGYQPPSAAGVVNGEKYKYLAASADLTQWEIGEGAYNTSTGVLPRTSVLYNSSGTGSATGQSGAGSKINFTLVPNVAIVGIKEDLLALDEANSFSTTQQNQAQKNLGIPATLQGYLYGLTLSTAGSSATFAVGAGVAADSSGADFMKLSASISKTTSAWSAGTGNGALDTGAIAANTWYHVHLIKNVGTQTVDALVSLSPTSPSLPSGYTLARRIGSMKTDGSSHWTAFIQTGNQFLWATLVNDVNTTLGTVATNYSVSAPTGVVVEARLQYEFGGSGGAGLRVYCPNVSDQAQSGSTPTMTATALYNSAGYVCYGEVRVTTNTSGQVRAVSDTAGQTFRLSVIGWADNLGANMAGGGGIGNPVVYDSQQNLSSTQQRQARANISAAGYGFVNKLRNSTLSAWFHGTSLTIPTTGGWSAEGVYIVPMGASVAAAQSSNGLSSPLSAYSLKITGAASVTDVAARFVVESFDAAPLAGQQVTFQVPVLNNTGGSITPAITVKHPSAQDNYTTTTTDISAVALQMIANGASGILSYSWAMAAGAINGVSISIDFGNNFNANTKSVQIGGGFDLRATPGVAAGLLAVPPDPEIIRAKDDLEWCERFYETSYDNGVAPGTASRSGLYLIGVSTSVGTAGAPNGNSVQFRTIKRTAPTMLYWDGAGNANTNSNYLNGAWSDNEGSNVAVVGGTKNVIITNNRGAGAEATCVFVHYAADATIAGA